MTIRCPECHTENPEGSKFCGSCQAKLPASGIREPAGVAQPRSAPPQRATGQNPTTVAVLSFLIPGLGQFMNGDTKKGLVMLGAVVLTAGALWILMAPWAAYDAYQVAGGKGKVWA